MSIETLLTFLCISSFFMIALLILIANRLLHLCIMVSNIQIVLLKDKGELTDDEILQPE